MCCCLLLLEINVQIFDEPFLLHPFFFLVWAAFVAPLFLFSHLSLIPRSSRLFKMAVESNSPPWGSLRMSKSLTPYEVKFPWVARPPILGQTIDRCIKEQCLPRSRENQNRNTRAQCLMVKTGSLKAALLPLR